MTTPNTPGSLTGHVHQWFGYCDDCAHPSEQQPNGNASCSICELPIGDHIATLEARLQAAERALLDAREMLAECREAILCQPADPAIVFISRDPNGVIAHIDEALTRPATAAEQKCTDICEPDCDCEPPKLRTAEQEAGECPCSPSDDLCSCAYDCECRERFDHSRLDANGRAEAELEPGE